MDHSLALFLCALSLLSVGEAAAAKVPWKDWPFCKTSDPKMNECIAKAVNTVKPNILDGNSYFGTPPLEPLHLTKISMDQGGGNHKVAVNLTFNEVDISGLRSFEVVEAKAEWDKNALWGKIKLHEPITISGGYVVSGKVLILPIQGNGICNFTFVNTMAELNMKLKTIEKKGKSYFQVTDMSVYLDPTRLHVYLDNLFNGNKALGDNMNQVINDNWSELLADMRGSLSDALGQAFTLIANKVFAKIPKDVIALQ